MSLCPVVCHNAVGFDVTTTGTLHDTAEFAAKGKSSLILPTTSSQFVDQARRSTFLNSVRVAVPAYHKAHSLSIAAAQDMIIRQLLCDKSWGTGRDETSSSCRHYLASTTDEALKPISIIPLHKMCRFLAESDSPTPQAAAFDVSHVTGQSLSVSATVHVSHLHCSCKKKRVQVLCQFANTQGRCSYCRDTREVPLIDSNWRA